MSTRAEAFYERTIAELGYRISPRLPLKYRLARLIQRIFDDERPEKLSLAEATMMGQLAQVSMNTGCHTETVYAGRVRGQPTQALITRLRGYPDGGVSIRHWKKTVRHHPMRLRPRRGPLAQPQTAALTTSSAPCPACQERAHGTC